ncbi:MAG: SLBB domain-containing protein [Bacteroidaceae bacterium]|nr:SLBB domain-containing protein [Bacteroidaceae bacterium]
MKRFLFALMLALLYAGQSSAQMSDEDVIAFAKEQHEAGKSPTAILLELQKKGVKKEQLLRLKAQYESMQGENGLTIADASAPSGAGDRMRQANGNSQTKALESDFVPMVRNTATSGKQIFGHDIFQNDKLSFEPNMNIATPASYVLGPGDEVLIDIYGTSQSSKKYAISPEGTIIVEKIGPVTVSGLTIDQAQAKVSAKMGQHYQGSSIKLTVGQTRTVVVNVLGEVINPGTYTLSAFSTVFNALYLAGGVTDIGTLRNIKVSRNGKIISKIDVYDYIINGRLTGNIMLQDNDAIIVGAYDALVNIQGAIKRPMYYEMKENETLKSLLEYAGGYKSEANKSIINVERKTDNGLTVHTVEEWDFASFGIKDGDLVSVNGIIGRYQNMVHVTGAVFYPGHYEISNECNSVRTLIEKAGGIKEDAFTDRVVLFRMNETRKRKSMSIDLTSILSGNAPDVILENEDSLAVESDEKIAKERKYYVYGPIVRPGSYQFVEGMTLEDAIIAAGGLREEALLGNIEIARRLQYTDEHDPTFNKKAKIYSFEVESGLPVKEGQGFLLKPFDVITIKRNPEYADMAVVQISGEVKYPGSYSLRSRDERLSDLIARAGGLTDAGFAEGARFSRSLTPDEKERAKQLLEMAHSADTIDINKIAIKDRYPVGVDLNKAISKPGCDKDIILRNGDHIEIPQRNNTVRISGEVLYPNTVPFVEDKSVSYYINQAGGVSSRGHRSKAFIIYANGQVSRLYKGRVKPGCEIVIPSKPDKQYDSQRIPMILAGVSTLSTIGAIIIAALRR